MAAASAATADALAASWGAENAPYLEALRRAIPRDGILVGDTTMMTYLGALRCPTYGPRTWITPTGYLTLGFAFPAALGAKVAKPETPVVALVDPGSAKASEAMTFHLSLFRSPQPPTRD